MDTLYILIGIAVVVGLIVTAEVLHRLQISKRALRVKRSKSSEAHNNDWRAGLR